jgi:hypothetical protein
VTYSVEGAEYGSTSSHTTDATITYTTTYGTVQAGTQPLPWKTTVTLSPGATFRVTAQLDDGGTEGTTYEILCSVFGVGSPVPTSTSTDSLADVSCDGTVP